MVAAFLGLLPTVAAASCAEGCRDAESIGRTLDSGISLNQKLERTAKGDSEEYQAAHQRVAAFLESVAPIFVDLAVQLASRNDDDVMVAKPLEFALEMGSSADESIPTVLGLIFVANLEALERAARQLQPEDRMTCSRLMNLGLENAIAQSHTDDVTVRDRRDWLQRLRDF